MFISQSGHGVRCVKIVFFMDYFDLLPQDDTLTCFVCILLSTCLEEKCGL